MTSPLLAQRLCTASIHHLHRRLVVSSSLFSSLSAEDEMVESSIDEGNGVAMLVMNRPSLSLEMNEAISSSIKSIDATYPKVQSVVLASSNPTIFSAGLDVAELIRPDPTRLPLFWNSLQQVYLDLYGSRLATVACIQGHAPAAGCFLAMACDYRAMYAGGDLGGKKHVPTIGLNETQLGIAAPPWMGQLLVRTIGFRKAELALAMGTLFPPNSALDIGLVDEIISDSDSVEHSSSDAIALKALLPDKVKHHSFNPVMQHAYKQAALMARISPDARVASKLVTRSDLLQDFIAKRQDDTDHFCGFVTQDEVQRNLMEYVQKMKEKRNKK
ncbi:hypothetical protein ACHAWC_003865 [Mediolabrus comicus]